MKTLIICIIILFQKLGLVFVISTNLPLLTSSGGFEILGSLIILPITMAVVIGGIISAIVLRIYANQKNNTLLAWLEKILTIIFITILLFLIFKLKVGG